MISFDPQGDLAARIDAAAKIAQVSRSEWLRAACESALTPVDKPAPAVDKRPATPRERATASPAERQAKAEPRKTGRQTIRNAPTIPKGGPRPAAEHEVRTFFKPGAKP